MSEKSIYLYNTMHVFTWVYIRFSLRVLPVNAYSAQGGFTVKYRSLLDAPHLLLLFFFYAPQVGTQRFMAPERLKGHRATPQSDLWSLGASLAMSALGDGFLSQASNEFEQLDLAGNVRRTLAEATTISRQLADFLHQFLSRDPARRPALRELMKHRFLEQRYEWTKKCPEVPKAMRTRKRQQREDESALSTDEVLDALCRKRAENNLINSRVDPETAADLAYELGVTATSLVRDVHRRTLELIRAPGGGGGVVGVSDSGGDSEDKGNRGKGRYSLGMGYAAGCSLSSDAERIRYKRRNRRRRGSGGDGEKEDGERSRGKHGASRLGAVDSFGHTDSDPDTDEMLSPMKPPPLPEPSEQDWKPQPSAVVDSMDPNNTSNISCLPRTPRVSSTGGGGTTAFPGAPGTATPSGKSGSSSSRRTRRRPVEMSSSVKLTPHKRRGERRSSSQTKRSGHSCEADGTRARRSRSRRGRGHRERGTPKELTTTSASAHHIHGTTERDNLDGGGTAGYRRSVEREQVEEKPRTTESPTLPSRTDVPLRSTRGVFQLADKMKAEISVRNRCHRLQVYPDCFTGREAVQWMLEGGHASSVIDAEKLGNEMMKASVFQHILNSHVFEDSAVYYQFTDGETPPPPARGGQRLRQIARVFRGHVARKIVHHHHQGGGAFSSGNDSISGSGVGIGGGLDDEMSPAEEATHVCTSKRCMCPQEEGTGGGSEVGARDVAPRSIDASAATVFYSHRQQRPVHDSKKAISARSKHRNCRVPVRRHGNGVSQARRFSHSTSTVTVPETPC